jgi:hypothetical protein
VRDIARANGVYREGEIQRLSRHAARCLPCMKEFVGLMRAAASATPSGTIGESCAEAFGPALKHVPARRA